VKNLKVSVFVFLVISVILFVINLLTSIEVLWSLLAIIPLSFIPLTHYYLIKRNVNAFVSISTLLVVVFFLYINFRFSSNYLWFLYLVVPIGIFPAYIFLKRKFDAWKVFSVLVFGSLVFYVTLNLLFDSSSYFSAYTSYFFAFVYLSALGYKKGYKLATSTVLTIVNIGALYFINIKFDSDFTWWYFAIGIMMIWPLVAVLNTKKASMVKPIVISAFVVAVYSFINVIVFTDHPFIIYVLFACLLYIEYEYFRLKKSSILFGVLVTITISLLLASINWFVADQTI